MFKLEDLNPKAFPTTLEIDRNLISLTHKMESFSTLCPIPITKEKITSALRDLADHKRIYIEKAKKLGTPITAIRIPMGSKHLIGAAVDIADKDGSLYRWCVANENWLKECGLYCEKDTVGWVHFQIVPPKSGNTFFYP